MAIAKIFHVQNNDLPSIYSKLSGFLKLINDAERNVSNIDDPKKVHFLNCFPPIKRAFENISLTQSWESNINNIGESDIGLLGLAGELLDEYNKELLIPDNELNEVLSEVEELYQKVINSKIESRLRIVILDLLETIKNSINDYQISGAEGLTKALAESIGRMGLDRVLVKKEEENTVVKEFWHVLKKISTLVGMAYTYYRLGDDAGELFSKLIK